MVSGFLSEKCCESQRLCTSDELHHRVSVSGGGPAWTCEIPCKELERLGVFRPVVTSVGVI